MSDPEAKWAMVQVVWGYEVLTERARKRREDHAGDGNIEQEPD